MRFKDFYDSKDNESANTDIQTKDIPDFISKLKFNKEFEDTDSMKQKISDLLRTGMTIEAIEAELKIKIKTPEDIQHNDDKARFIISKTYTIEKNK
jgi:hypothetical protein